MKKELCFGIMTFMVAALFILPGCKKITQPGVGCCNIKRFAYAGSPLGVGRLTNDTMWFTYNASGNPVSGIRAFPSTGYPNFLFRYDHFNRLTDLIGVYGQSIADGVESWIKYFYDGRGRIISDSIYGLPLIVNGRPTIAQFTSPSVTAYEYDSEDRINKVSWQHFVTTYSYDPHGNLVGPSYDNKVNFHQTNKIWMFIDRDYSVNNPITASYTYNAVGLPTRIVPFAGTVGHFMTVAGTSLEFSAADIEYDCH
jgi:hypothetical protein